MESKGEVCKECKGCGGELDGEERDMFGVPCICTCCDIRLNMISDQLSFREMMGEEKRIPNEFDGRSNEFYYEVLKNKYSARSLMK